MTRTSEPPNGTTQPPPGPGDVVIGRVDPRDRRPALALLLTGRADAAEPVVETFFGFAAEQNLGLDNLWAARRGGQVLASALVAPCAGRTGLLYLSPNVTAALVPIAADLVTAACRGQDSRQVRMIQALLDPGQEPIGLALDAAGFQRLAVLIYMQRGVQPHPVPLDLEPGIEAHTWAPGARPAFARAILASYEQTLDCPGLLGLRDIGDIIDGHMATGKFVPELWLRLESRGAPVGVMLLNVVPQRAALELVYLGLSPAWRGRGLARRLLLHGLGLAPRYGANQMILAVDDHNAPALRMYTALRFAPVARKAALILPLTPKTP